MQNAEIISFVTTNLIYIVGALTVITAVLFVVVIVLSLNLSSLKKRYAEMMTGEQTGTDFETMLLDHIAKTDRALAETSQLRGDVKRINGLLATGITRVGVIRFRAFEDTGSDLSYAVALMDSANNGVVLSSIFGREDSRSYVKPLKGGKCDRYILTEEEEEAIRQAIQNAYK